MENIKDFINIICPEHGRTSCSDDNLFNGFYFKSEEEEIINEKHRPRCIRCALLEIEKGNIKLTDENKRIIARKLIL